MRMLAIIVAMATLAGSASTNTSLAASPSRPAAVDHAAGTQGPIITPSAKP